MSIVMKRKSVREFKTTKVTEKQVEALLRAGMQAPSANNQQPWEFIVVTDRQKLDALSEMSRGSWPLKTAPLAIIPIMLPGKKSPHMAVQDVSASTQNILLEAVEIGLGGVWIGVNPLEDRIKYVKDLYNIQDDVTPFCIIALGTPKDKSKVVSRYDESRVHYDQW